MGIGRICFSRGQKDDEKESFKVVKYMSCRLNRGKHSVEENVIIKFHIFNPHYSWEAKNVTFILLSDAIIVRFLLNRADTGIWKNSICLKKQEVIFIIKWKIVTRVPGFTFALRKW